MRGTKPLTPSKNIFVRHCYESPILLDLHQQPLLLQHVPFRHDLRGRDIADTIWDRKSRSKNKKKKSQFSGQHQRGQPGCQGGGAPTNKQLKTPPCATCKRTHLGQCPLGSTTYFLCSQEGHMMKVCLQLAVP